MKLKSAFLLVLLSWLLLGSPAWATTYYVGATTAGAANCLTSAANNCLLATALAIPPAAGDTITMANGTYQGANSMFVCSAKAGTSGNRITLMATNDGQVLIDGQDAREPVKLTNCDYWSIQGINAGNSSGAVVYLTSGSDNNEFKRVCAWDALVSGNYHVWVIEGSANNLIEDSCGFGTGRKIFETFETAGPNTVRRFWGQFVSNTWNPGFEAPKETVSIYYNSKNTTFENIIATQKPRAGTSTTDHYGISTGDQWTTYDPDRAVNTSILASIFYLPSGINFYSAYAVRTNRVDEIHYLDVVVYLPADQSTVKPFFLGNCKTADSGGSDCSVDDLTIIDASLIGGTASDIEAHWAQTNVDSGATVAAVYGAESLYVNDGTKGATICYRTVNGTLTATPLWPWPMNQRILDAMTTAGETAIDVTATIEGIFGAVPAACEEPQGPPTSITTTAPIAASIQRLPDAVSVEWTTNNISSGTVDLTYSFDSFVTSYSIVSGVAYNSSPYVWAIPTWPKQSTMQVKVCQGATCGTSPTFETRGLYLK